MLNVQLESGLLLTVAAKAGDKLAKWSPAGQHYRVVVSVKDASSFGFDFWDSLASLQAGKECDLESALQCFAGDCLTGLQNDSADDLANDFGYDDLEEAKRVYQACQRSLLKALRAGLSEDDLIELSELDV